MKNNENNEKYDDKWKIMKNTGKGWKALKSTGKHWKALESTDKH